MEKMSITLTARIKESESEILALEGRLATIGEERAGILGAPAVDPKTLQRVDADAQKITAALAAQRERISLLHEQIEEAERAEAALRIGAIESEHEALAATLKAQHQQWLEGLEQLAHILEQSRTLRDKIQLLSDEAAFLHERYAAAWPHLEPAPFPSRGDIAKKLESSLQKASWILHASNIWHEKTAEIRRAKDALAHRAAEEQRALARSQSMVRRGTPEKVR